MGPSSRPERPVAPAEHTGHRTRRVAELAGDLGRRQAGTYLRVVLRARQDVPGSCVRVLAAGTTRSNGASGPGHWAALVAVTPAGRSGRAGACGCRGAG